MKKRLLRLKSKLLLPMLFLLLMAMSMVGMGQTVTTDKQDYAPESTVYITGNGFIGATYVALTIFHQDSDPNHSHNAVTWYEEVDSNGNFTSSWLVEEIELNTTLILSAIGTDENYHSLEPLMVDETTFTDGRYNAFVSATSEANQTNVCQGGNVHLSINSVECSGSNISGMSNTTYTANYQWQQSTDNNSWNDIIDKTTQSCNVNPTVNTYYRCKITLTYNPTPTQTCSSAFTGSFYYTLNDLLITVNQGVTFDSQPQSANVCLGTPVIFSVSISNVTSPGYQWYKNGNLISGATNQSYTIASVLSNDEGSYTVIVSGGSCGNVTSQAALLTVNDLPDAPTAVDQTACEDGSGNQTLTASANPVTEGSTVVWYDEDGEVTTTPTQVGVGTSTYFAAAVSAEDCESLTRTEVVLTINPAPLAPTAVDQTACEDGSENQTLTASANPVTEGSTVVWYDEDGEVTTTPTQVGVGTSTYFAAAVSAEDCESLTRTEVVLTINPAPLAPTANNVTVTFDCQSHSASANAPTGSNIEWYTTATGNVTTTAPTGTNAGTYKAWAESVDDVTGCTSLTRTEVTLTINPVDVCVYYSGVSVASTANPSSDQFKVVLAVTLKAATNNCGLTNAGVIFKIGGNPLNGSSPAPIGLVSSTDPTTGTAIYEWTGAVPNIGYETYDITWSISGGNYISNNQCGDQTATVNVSKPMGEFITGGGYLVLTSATSGIKAGNEGSKNNFGFNVKWNKSVKNLQGNINTIIRRTEEKDGLIHTWQVKGNVMSSLTVNATTKEATFTGKATIKDVSNLPLDMLIAGDGNATIQVTMKDVAEPGKDKDLLAVTVWNKAGGVWFTSKWNGTKTEQQTIAHGNLQVNPSGLKSASIATAVEPVIEKVEPTLRAYPNPFTERLNIEFSSATDTQATLEIYSITGAKLATLFNGPVNGGELYTVDYLPNLVSSQMVFYHLTMNGKTQVGKVIYQERR